MTSPPLGCECVGACNAFSVSFHIRYTVRFCRSGFLGGFQAVCIVGKGNKRADALQAESIIDPLKP